MSFRTASHTNEPIYRFKHALTQEVAYESMLTPRRQRLHMLTAQAFEQMYAERLVDAYDRLAYHYSKAEDAEKAVLYLRRFAEKTAQEHAPGEAILALQQALVYSERLPDTLERQRLLLNLHLQWANCLVALGRYEETLEHLHQQQPRLAQSQDAWLAGRYALLQSQTVSYLGDWQQAVSCAERAVEDATRSCDDTTLGQAYHVLAMERYWTDNPLQGVTYSQQAIITLERSGDNDRVGMAHFVLALNALLLGDFETALAAVAHVSAIGEVRQDRRLLTFAAWTTGWLQATRGEYESAIVACRRALESSSDPLNTAFATGWLGYAYLEKGDADAAIPLLEQATHSLCQFGYRRLEGLYTTLLGKAHLLHGNPDKAHHLASQGLAIVSDIPYHTGLAWAHRTLGHIAQVTGTLAQAEQFLTEAWSIFHAIPARFEIGRAHLDLAKLAQHQSNREAMTLHLAEAYHLFVALDVSAYVAHVTQYAHEYGLTFTTAQFPPTSR